MPLIPDLNPNVPGRALPVAPDVGTAMAPGRALQRVGSGISAVGETVGAFQLQMQKARDQGVKNKARLWMQEAYAQHEKFRLENPDETTWQANLDGLMGGVRQRLDGEQLSPFAKEELDAEFAGWESNARSGLMVDATRHRVARDRTNETRLDELYRQSGDHASRRKLVDESPLWSESEKEVKRREIDFDEQEKSKADRFNSDIAEIDADPFAARGKFEGNAPDGEDATEWARKRDHLRSRLARERNAIVDGINDGLASGQITRPEQLDEWTDELGESAVSSIKAAMAKSADANREAMVKTDGYQARMIGAVSAAISSLKPDDIDARVAIEARLREIEPGVSKDLLSADLRRKLGGEPEDYSPLSRGKKLVDLAFRSGALGPVGFTAPQTTADVVGDDFLMDGAKLQALGVSKEWQDKVQDPKVKSADERVRLFTEAMRARPKDAKITADDYTRRAADAIVGRKNNVAKTPEEAAKEMRGAWDTVAKRGRIERQLAEWAKAHPDGDIEAEAMRLLGDEATGKAIDFGEEEGAWSDIGDYTPGAEMSTLPGMNGGTSGFTDTLLPPRE